MRLRSLARVPNVSNICADDVVQLHPVALETLGGRAFRVPTPCRTFITLRRVFCSCWLGVVANSAPLLLHIPPSSMFLPDVYVCMTFKCAHPKHADNQPNHRRQPPVNTTTTTATPKTPFHVQS